MEHSNKNIQKETPRSDDNTNREVAIYDNDEAYMLDDDKHQLVSDPERLQDEDADNLDMDLLEDMNHQLSEEDGINEDYRGITDEDTIRNKVKQHDEDINSNLSSSQQQRTNQNEENFQIKNTQKQNINNNNNIKKGKEKEQISNDSRLKSDKNVDYNNQGSKSSKINILYKANKEQEHYQSNLITLKYISVCQCCKETFNADLNIPYLLKCGHFFCKECLVNNFTHDNGQLECPEDGTLANSLNDLTLLNNLIISSKNGNELETQRESVKLKVYYFQGYCETHPNQRLSHYIEDTGDVICVYCAFNIFKKHPKYDIKEVGDKCKEILEQVDSALIDNQNYVEILRQNVEDIKENKLNEIEKINALFDNILNFISNKKAEAIESVETIFSHNTKMISEKLEHFCNKIDNAEDIKTNILKVMNNESSKINTLLSSYNNFSKDISDPSKLNLELVEYKYSHDDENKLFKYLSNFGDLKQKTNFIKFNPKHFLAAQTNQLNLKQINSNNKDNNKSNENNNYTSNDYNVKTNKYTRNEHKLSNTYNEKYEKNYTNNNDNLTSWSNTRKNYDSNYLHHNNSEMRQNRTEILDDNSDLADDFMEAKDYGKDKRKINTYNSKKDYSSQSDKLKGELSVKSNKPESN